MNEITNIREQQLILNEGLKYLKKVCEKNNITYYLCNGTLLGAIKYQGFIPWDDDVDIMIPREDFDKLMKLENIDSKKFVFVSKERTMNWKMPYAKLYNTETIAKETSADFGVEIGLAIDIFPIDNWSNWKPIAVLQAKYCSLLRRMMTASIETEFNTKKKGWKKIILKIIWTIAHIVGDKRILKAINNQIKVSRKINSKYCGSVAWAPYASKEIIPKNYFKSSVNVEFEMEEYKTFIGCKEYLNQMYGDYTNDPPKEKQHPHHGLKVWRRYE